MTTAINLSIVSHTNIGKTTLTRTLLSRDVGEVADRAHVTVSCDPYTLAKTADSAELILWDTPGFGNSVALAKRLEGRSNPLGWFMSEVWDRAVNKSQWINQQALLHVKDTSSVVLYLVNADQLPDTTPYVTAEMQILEWLEKPVIVLLNQLGEPKSAREENQLVARWKQALEGFPIVKTVLAMDAFARCWVQEYSLFDAVGDALPDNLKAAFAELKNEWLTGRRAAYDQSTAALSRFMNDRVNDTEVVTVIPLAKRLKLFGKSVGLLKSKTPAPDTSDAQKTLSQKADEAFQDLAQELLSINGLSGTVEPQTLFARMETVWTPRANRRRSRRRPLRGHSGRRPHVRRRRLDRCRGRGGRCHVRRRHLQQKEKRGRRRRHVERHGAYPLSRAKPASLSCRRPFRSRPRCLGRK